ncbi:DNA repair protein RadC [Vitreoscilla massiliensis]|uniref:DNA repair protein RadC n=1 Tax=Vitreoscilla massiliensis TaxID=1689272 RepID=A0ABY4E7N4_9NEIS|nr:DNA repair protein RadC [Vitreoscilla massiliensis]UOO91279.1 DNA repair protein RadC [Vitreoscilla massiliensis]
MSIKDWPEGERPREKLLQAGVGVLSDAELLAVLLRVGSAGCSAVDNARSLIQHFGSLAAVMQASHADLTACKGMGDTAYSQFAVVLEIGRRVLLQQQQRLRIDTAEDLLPLLRLQFAGESVEVLYAALLDSNNQLLKLLPISRGSLSHHTVYARELAKLALQHHAAAIILAHNHPSGSLQPSTEDMVSTEYLQAALQLLDIRLLDHLIVTAHGHCSVWAP